MSKNQSIERLNGSSILHLKPKIFVCSVNSVIGLTTILCKTEILFGCLKKFFFFGEVYKNGRAFCVYFSCSKVLVVCFQKQPTLFTILLRNWLSRKWAATWAGSRLYRMCLLDSCRTAISRFSCDACNCHRKSNRAVHSTWRPCAKMAIMKMTMRASDIVCSGIDELERQNKKMLSKQSHKTQRNFIEFQNDCVLYAGVHNKFFVSLNRKNSFKSQFRGLYKRNKSWNVRDYSDVYSLMQTI